jgi:anti-sigma28 factor (negative regulator of flagellin synthesis)
MRAKAITQPCEMDKPDLTAELDIGPVASQDIQALENVKTTWHTEVRMTGNFIANEMKRRIAAISVLRQERVDDLKQRLGAGTYVIRTDLVARALLKEQVLGEVLLSGRHPFCGRTQDGSLQES